MLLLQSVLGVTKCDRFSLQGESGITKCDRLYCKVRQASQSVTVITKWDVAVNELVHAKVSASKKRGIGHIIIKLFH